MGLGQNTMFPQTATVKRPRYTQDSAGAAVAVYSAILKTRCRIYQTTGNKRVSSGSQGEVAEYGAMFPAGTSIKAQDRILLGADEYDIMTVMDVYRAAVVSHVEATLQRVKR